MGYIVIAPVGDNPKALFVGIKEFPTERVILLTPPDKLKAAKKLEKQLDTFTIPSQIIRITGSIMEDMFIEFGNIVGAYGAEKIIVNVATGDRMSTCAALSASYANGIQAFGVMENHTMLLPILKLSYYNELSENKMAILQKLQHYGEISLNDLAKHLKMSLSLLSYHINGNYKYKGLVNLRMVQTRDDQKNVKVELSDMGKLLLRGYNPTCEDCDHLTKL